MNSTVTVSSSSSPRSPSGLQVLRLLECIFTLLGSLFSVFLIVSMWRIKYLSYSFRLFLSLSTSILLLNALYNMSIHSLEDLNNDLVNVENSTALFSEDTLDMLHLISHELQATHWSSMTTLVIERFIATVFVEDYDNRFHSGCRINLAVIGVLVFVIRELIRVFVSVDSSMRFMLWTGLVPSVICIPSMILMNRRWSRIPLYQTHIAVKMTVKSTRILYPSSIVWLIYQLSSLALYYCGVTEYDEEGAKTIEEFQYSAIALLSLVLPGLIVTASHLRHFVQGVPCIGPCITALLAKDEDEEDEKRERISRFSTSI